MKMPPHTTKTLIELGGYRDGGTKSMIVNVDGIETEYLIHAANPANSRTDVTKRTDHENHFNLSTPCDHDEILELLALLMDGQREPTKEPNGKESHYGWLNFSILKALVVSLGFGWVDKDLDLHSTREFAYTYPKEESR